MKTEDGFSQTYRRAIATFLSISTGVSLVVWMVFHSMVWSNEQWFAIRMALAVSAGALLTIALLLGFIWRHYLEARLDFVRRTLIDAVTGQERLRRLPPDAFGSLSSELTTAIQKLKARVRLLEQETDQLATLLSSMAEAVIMTNEHERVLVANPRALKLFDLAKPKFDDPSSLNWQGKRLGELTSYRNLTDIASDVLWQGKPRIEDIVYEDKVQNDTFYYSVSSSPIRNFDEVVVGVVLVLYDVTRLRRLERVRRDFVANVSHELRTPIASIKSSAETILLPEINLPDVAVDFSEAILRNANRMGSIVEDLLTLSRLEAEGGLRGLTKVSLPKVFAEIWERCSGPAKEASIHFDAELPEDFPYVYSKHRALCQVLYNLVENAIKYNHAGGEVRIDAELHGKDVAIRVKDNGPGIPKEHLPRIFERFYRVDKGRSRDVGGTGLGLAIVKHNVRAMGGRITVTSQPGETQFTVYIKAYTVDSPKTLEPEPLLSDTLPPIAS